MLYSRILAPVDGSETAELGRQEALRIARDQGSQLRFLYVVDSHVMTMDPYGTINTGEFIAALRECGRSVLDGALESARAQGVEATGEVVESFSARPGAAIVDEARAWGADLVVMGTHGRRGMSHLLMGSDAELVVRTSPAPVLLVRQANAATA